MKRVQAQAFKISPELESIFGEELYSFKGGSEGGASDPTMLDEVIITVEIPDDDPIWGDTNEEPIEIPTDEWNADDWEDFVNNTDNPDETSLTPEQLWALLHPIAAIQAYQNQDQAKHAVKSLPGLHNGIGDAFRHAYWMSLNAQDFGSSLAILLGIAHEESVVGPANETAMDLNNNEWGANWGAAHPDGTFQEFIDAFNEAAKNGDIDVLEGGIIPIKAK